MADEKAPAPPSGGGEGNVIIIKKKARGGHGGHHGGAWKVAYADFVTAMMAFFLLLWLLSTTTQEQKMGIAHYFNPPNNSSEYGGGAGIMGGDSPIAAEQHAPKDTPLLPPKQDSPDDITSQVKEDAMFRQVSEQMTKALMNVPELKALMENVLIDITPEGLRIQIVDKTGRPLFYEKSAKPYPYTKEMLSVIATVLAQLPNKLAMGGHTDAIPFRGNDPAYSNWELSADRANTARRTLNAEGIPERRLAKVVGYGSQELLLQDHPADPQNNRLSIIVLRSKKGPVAVYNQNGITPQAGPLSAPSDSPPVSLPLQAE